MTDLARLLVRMEAQTAQYQQELDKARGRLEKFERKSRSAATRIGQATSAALLATAGATAAMVSRQAALADQTKKTADRLGFTTEQLSRLGFAAEMTSDISRNQFDTAMQRMVRRLADAAKGSGDAKDAIDELGLDAQKLARSGPDAAFKAIADSLSGLPSQSDKVRIAFKLFDSEGVKLINTLDQGSDGIERLGQRADQLGVTIDNKAAAAAERFNDNITELSRAGEGFQNQLTARLMPTLLGLSQEMLDASSNAEGMEGALDGVETVARGVAGGLLLAGSTVTRFTQAAAALANFAVRSAQVLGDFDQLSFGELRQRLADEGGLLTQNFDDISANYSHDLERFMKVLRDGFTQINDVEITSPQSPLEALAERLNNAPSINPIELPGLATVDNSKRVADQLAEDMERWRISQLSMREQLQITAEKRKAMIEQNVRDEGARAELLLYTERRLQQELLDLQRESQMRSSENAEAQLDKIASRLEKSAEDRLQAQRDLMLGTAQVFDDLAGITESFAGKQSGAFRALFGISRSFALAESIISLQQAIARANALGFPANIGAIAQASSIGLSAINTIRSVRFGGGRALGGRVDPMSFVEVGEGNRPELVEQGGKFYLIGGNQGADVEPSRRAGGGDGGGVVINLMEDASRAGQTRSRTENEREVIDVFVSNIFKRGDAAIALEGAYPALERGSR